MEDECISPSRKMEDEENNITEVKKNTITYKTEDFINAESDELDKSNLGNLDPDYFEKEFFSGDEDQEYREIDAVCNFKELDHKKDFDLKNKEGKDPDNPSNILNENDEMSVRMTYGGKQNENHLSEDQHRSKSQEATAVTVNDGKGNRTVILMNFLYVATPEEIQEIFNDCGEIETLEIAKDCSKPNLGLGYLAFKNVHSAQKALTKDRHPILGRSLYVNAYELKDQFYYFKFKKGRDSEKDKLFVKGLPPSMSEEEVKNVFLQHAPIKYTIIPVDGNGHSKGSCYIDYHDEETAAKVQSVMDGVQLEEKVISVKFRKPILEGASKAMTAHPTALGEEFDEMPELGTRAETADLLATKGGYSCEICSNSFQDEAIHLASRFHLRLARMAKKTNILSMRKLNDPDCFLQCPSGEIKCLWCNQYMHSRNAKGHLDWDKHKVAAIAAEVEAAAAADRAKGLVEVDGKYWCEICSNSLQDKVSHLADPMHIEKITLRNIAEQHLDGCDHRGPAVLMCKFCHHNLQDKATHLEDPMRREKVEKSTIKRYVKIELLKKIIKERDDCLRQCPSGEIECSWCNKFMGGLEAIKLHLNCDLHKMHMSRQDQVQQHRDDAPSNNAAAEKPGTETRAEAVDLLATIGGYRCEICRNSFQDKAIHLASNYHEKLAKKMKYNKKKLVKQEDCLISMCPSGDIKCLWCNVTMNVTLEGLEMVKLHLDCDVHKMHMSRQEQVQQHRDDAPSNKVAAEEGKACVKETRLTKKTGKIKVKDETMPRRPMSAFFLWLNENRDQIEKDNPGISRKQVSKKAGALWIALEDKTKWEKMQVIAKEDYAVAMEEWRAADGGKKGHDDDDASKKGKSEVEGGTGKTPANTSAAAVSEAGVGKATAVAPAEAVTESGEGKVPATVPAVDSIVSLTHKVDKNKLIEELMKQEDCLRQDKFNKIKCSWCNIKLNDLADIKGHLNGRKHRIVCQKLAFDWPTIKVPSNDSVAEAADVSRQFSSAEAADVSIQCKICALYFKDETLHLMKPYHIKAAAKKMLLEKIMKDEDCLLLDSHFQCLLLHQSGDIKCLWCNMELGQGNPNNVKTHMDGYMHKAAAKAGGEAVKKLIKEEDCLQQCPSGSGVKIKCLWCNITINKPELRQHLAMIRHRDNAPSNNSVAEREKVNQDIKNVTENIRFDSNFSGSRSPDGSDNRLKIRRDVRSRSRSPERKHRKYDSGSPDRRHRRSESRNPQLDNQEMDFCGK